MNPRPLACLAAIATTGGLAAEVENDIPLGVEVVTGYRSEYIQRGFKWSNGLLDIQAGGEVALNNDIMLGFGAWYATGTGSGDFNEGAAFADLRWDINPTVALEFETTWKSVDHPIYESGLDLAPSVSWELMPDLRLAGGLAWNTGADGLYVFTEARWSKAVTPSGFLSADLGLSWVDQYYQRNGINDTYARLTYTQSINRSVSVTPFVGTSLPLQSNEERNRFFGGLWFEVNF